MAEWALSGRCVAVGGGDAVVGRISRHQGISGRWRGGPEPPAGDGGDGFLAFLAAPTRDRKLKDFFAGGSYLSRRVVTLAIYSSPSSPALPPAAPATDRQRSVRQGLRERTHVHTNTRRSPLA